MPPGTLFQAESTLTYATATGDYNGDGFIDFVSHKIGTSPEIRQSIPNGNNAMRILLHGTESNADAVGSKIELWAGSDYWYRETYCGEGYLAQNSRWEHFGLRITQPLIPSRSTGPKGPWKRGTMLRWKPHWN